MSTEVNSDVFKSLVKDFKRYQKEYSDEIVSKTILGNMWSLANETKGKYMTLEETHRERIDEDDNEQKVEFELSFESDEFKDSFDFIYYEKIR